VIFREDDSTVFAAGEYAGEEVFDVACEDPDFLRAILAKDAEDDGAPTPAERQTMVDALADAGEDVTAYTDEE